MAAQHTSVPRWAAEPPAADLTGRSFAVLSFGQEGRVVAQRWCAEVEGLGPLWTRHVDQADDVVLASLRDQLCAARVGWRLMLAGPEADVLAARSEALRQGAIGAEIVAHVTSSREKRVYCPHCKKVTAADHAVEETVRCGGCGRDLFIYYHVSRRIGAYLGFMVDAEAI